MNEVKKVDYAPTYKRENGLFVIDLEKVDIPFEVKEKSVVNIPPKQFGGNHKHPRWEAFIGIGNSLKLVWLDENGKKEESMNPPGTLYIYIIPPNLPHAVVNESDQEIGILLEFASESQHGVEVIEIVK